VDICSSGVLLGGSVPWAPRIDILRHLPHAATLLMMTEEQACYIIRHFPEALTMGSYHAFALVDLPHPDFIGPVQPERRTVASGGECVKVHFCSICGQPHLRAEGAYGCSVILENVYEYLEVTPPENLDERIEASSEEHIEAVATLLPSIRWWMNRLEDKELTRTCKFFGAKKHQALLLAAVERLCLRNFCRWQDPSLWRSKILYDA
jgi:hypothetical protein